MMEDHREEGHWVEGRGERGERGRGQWKLLE